MKRPVYVSLQCFRGIAALLVTTIHINVNNPFLDSSFRTGLFVQFFFVLSGFILTLNYSNKINNFSEASHFIKKRFWRLYPLHLFFLLIFLFLEIAKYIFVNKFGIETNRPIFLENNFLSFMSNLFLLQNFFGPPGSFNGPSWAVSAEFFTYLLFSLIILFFKKYIKYILFIFILCFLLFFSNYFNADWGVSGFLSCIYSFSFGVLAAELFKKKNFFKSKEIINFLFIIFLLITVYFLSSKSLGPFLSLAFAFLIYFSCLINPSEKKYCLVFNKFFIFLGKISYSIYLSHVFVYWVMLQFYRFVLNWESQSTNLGNQIVLNDFDGAVFLGLFFLCTIIFSYYTHRYVENKFRLSQKTN